MRALATWAFERSRLYPRAGYQTAGFSTSFKRSAQILLALRSGGLTSARSSTLLIAQVQARRRRLQPVQHHLLPAASRHQDPCCPSERLQPEVLLQQVPHQQVRVRSLRPQELLPFGRTQPATATSSVQQELVSCSLIIHPCGELITVYITTKREDGSSVNSAMNSRAFVYRLKPVEHSSSAQTFYLHL